MAFYQAALTAYSGADKDTVFCHTGQSPGKGKIEVTLQLGSSFLPSTGDKLIALWTHADGFIATCTVVLQLTFAFHDVSNSDSTVVFNAGTRDVDVLVPLSEFAVVTNTCENPSNISTSCVSGSQSLILHRCVDIEKATGLKLSYDSPTRAGYTRRLATKGFRGLRIQESTSQSTALTVNGTQYKAQSPIML